MPRRFKRKVLLPNEIYFHILEYIDIEQRFKFRRVSKCFKLFIDILNPYKYILELCSIPTRSMTHYQYCYMNPHKLICNCGKCDKNTCVRCRSSVCNGRCFRFVECSNFKESSQTNYHSINSIVCRANYMILENGYFYRINYKGINTMCSNKNRIKTLYLQTGDNIKLQCMDSLKHFYIDGVNITATCFCNLGGDEMINIVVSKRLVVIANSFKLLMSRRFKKTGKRPFPDFIEFGLRVNTIRSISCDGDDNIYVLHYDFIHKYDRKSKFMSRIEIFNKLIDHVPSLMVINSKNRIFVCNRTNIYVLDLNGILLLEINKKFKYLTSMTFDFNNNLIVVDNRTIYRIGL